jgi:hypothetical protein
VLADEIVVGRIMKAVASPVGTPWLWTLAYGYHEDPRLLDLRSRRQRSMLAHRDLTAWLTTQSAVN